MFLKKDIARAWQEPKNRSMMRRLFGRDPDRSICVEELLLSHLGVP
jgi:hypothetical protein